MSSSNEDFQPFPTPPAPEEKPAAPRATKLRPFAIGLVVLGLLILVGGITKMIPGGIATGAALCFAGILLIAFSFIPLPDIATEEEPLSFFDKLTVFSTNLHESSEISDCILAGLGRSL
jgi:hypothetical protein